MGRRTFTDFENFKLEVVRSTFYKGGGVVEWVWSGTEKGLFKTGKSFSVRGVSIIEVRGGKVSSYKEYYDFATVMRQLGLLPDKQR
jgi:ketosteroid isomerase-like protein